MAEKTFNVTGMHCGECETKIEASIKAERTALRGVTEPSVYNTRLMTLRQTISQLAQLRQELDLISPVTP